MSENLNYRVGIDVGLGGVGFAAIEVDENDLPLRLLSLVTHAHDAGIDPSQRKTNQTRLAVSGVARRSRRLQRERKRRRARLHTFLSDHDYPIVDWSKQSNQFYPWHVRAALADDKVQDLATFREMFSVAVQHMAAHRGWRSPYTSTASLRAQKPMSDNMRTFKEATEKKLGRTLPENSTIGQIAAEALSGGYARLRFSTADKLADTKHHGYASAPSDEGLLQGKLMQQDNANELIRIAEVQGLDDDFLVACIDQVFEQKSPRGSALGRVGKDPLPGQNGPRDSTASLAYQDYKVAAIFSNLRIQRDGTKRRLTSEEFSALLSLAAKAAEAPKKVDYTWDNVAATLGVERTHIKGTTQSIDDVHSSGSTPPINATVAALAAATDSTIRTWFLAAEAGLREAFIEAISNAGYEPSESPEHLAAEDFLASLPEKSRTYLETTLHLPSGRAAYSRDSLQRLTRRMLADGVDVHDARKLEFGVDDSWTPPAEPLDAKTGNPSVDRNNTIVARLLANAERRWGAPKAVTIEHVRAGFSSKAVAAEISREQNQRRLANQRTRATIAEAFGQEGQITRSDLRRYEIVTRQNGACLYCGATIDYKTCEIDHIVPQKGPGSTNRSDNLAATCRPCNQAKSNTIFALWAGQATARGVSLNEAVDRVKHWQKPDGMSGLQFSRFKRSVIARLKRTEEDDPLDGRSIESVAWMARELASRITRHFQDQGADTKVAVYRGAITSDARKASGLEKKIPYAGADGSKNRFDRRHHAVDAAVIAMMNPSVARTLALRQEIRNAERLTRSEQQWKNFTGGSETAQVKFAHWRAAMRELATMIAHAMEADQVPVVHPVRLRLGNSKVHDDTIHKLANRRVGDAMTVEDIDRAATPALWCALTRHADFDSKDGLPENRERRITVNGTRLDAADKIHFAPGSGAFLAVNRGFVDTGNTIHHARIYQWPSGKSVKYGMVRVFTQDLVRHRDEDLFGVSLPPQSMSMRMTPGPLRTALLGGVAEPLGWLVDGDEVLVGTPEGASGAALGLLNEFSVAKHWVVSGFPSASKIRLRSAYLAAEGLPEDAPIAWQSIISGAGWRVEANVLFGKCAPTVVRRTALGQPRWDGSAGLPVSWNME